MAWVWSGMVALSVVCGLFKGTIGAVGSAALTVFRTLGLSVYARADFIVTSDGTPYFLEINTLPGMTPTSLVPQEAAAAGINYGNLCDTIIQKSLEARKEGL